MFFAHHEEHAVHDKNRRVILIDQTFTAIVRKSKLEYVAICLELNVTARGDNLADVEKNLRSSIELYLEDVQQFPETIVESVSSSDLIEFIKDTQPDWYKVPKKGLILRPLEIHEVPSYA
jgi:predicted RNase H-like HicB family nuclease